MNRVAKNLPENRKVQSWMSGSRIRTLPRRKILLPLTTPHGIIRRASETIADQGRTVEEIAEAIEGEIAGEDADAADAGDGAVAEAEAEAATGIVVDVTRARADAICRHRSTLRRKGNAIRAALTAGARMTVARWIAGQALRSNGETTISCCRANRWRNIAGDRCRRPSNRWAITNPRSASQISQSSKGVRQWACSRIPAYRGVFPGVCR